MRILLVDDEVLALHALEKRVDWDRHGFDEVLTARSAAEARALLSKDPVDLALCDIEMPGEDGLSLVEYIRETYPDTACIMVTCHADFNYLKQAMRSRVVDYILKPIDYEELDTLLDKLAREREAAAGKAARPSLTVPPLEEEPEDSTERRLERVKAYIEEHLAEKIYVADLARLVHLNDQYLMRVFKRANGKSVTEYITERRVQIARDMLRHSEHPIQYIADQVGFESVSYFNKQFKAATSFTPREYRSRFNQK